MSWNFLWFVNKMGTYLIKFDFVPGYSADFSESLDRIGARETIQTSEKNCSKVGKTRFFHKICTAATPISGPVNFQFQSAPKIVLKSNMSN